MFILTGANILCSGVFDPMITPTYVTDINYLSLTGTLFDDMYIANNQPIHDNEGNIIEVPQYEVPSEWTVETVMACDFDNTTDAGNVDWEIENIEAMLIRRKCKDDFKWTTVLYKEVNEIEDLNISGEDITPGNGEYVYSVVPITKNNSEYTYFETTKNPVIEMKRLLIADSTGYYTTLVTDGSCNVTCVVPSTTVETLYNKYPTIVSNSNANYKTISVSASFYPSTCDTNDIFDDYKRTRYIEEVLGFLCNRKPKLLKNLDGRRWLVWITTPPTDSAADLYKLRTITFDCTEIGEVESEVDLNQYGIIDIPEKYINW